MLSPASPDDPGITKSPLAEYVTEQTANTSSSTAHNVSRAQHLPFHHTHHKRHRLLHLIHPSGKHIHVVHHPRDLDERRRELARQHDDEKIDYELVVYGTPEHLSAVRDIQSHNLAKRETLRQKHPDVFQEFDLVHETLDHLSDELNHLTNRAIALDASFNKFGYHAHMRTIEDRHDAKHDPESGSASQSQSETDSSLQSYHDRSLQPLRFWKLPQIRQYLHKNLLWRSPESGEVGSFELFTDLIYVGVIDVIGETAVVNASAASFLHFVVVFTLAYKIWSDLTVVVNWFEVEDCVGRIAILFILCCLYGFNSNIEDFFHETFTAGIAFFLAQRCWHIAFFTLTSLEIRMIRGFLLLAALVASCSVILYIVAVHLEYPYSLIPLFFAMTVDLLAPMGTFFIVKHLKAGGNRFTQWLSKEFEFVPAVNIEHRCERTSAFTTLVFGYSVLKSLYQSRAHIGLNAFLGKGILALVQAFAIMWLYFDVDNWALHVHAIRRHWISSTCWISAHMPLAASFILASSTLSELILAHDSSNANIEDLIEAYASRSKGEIEQPLRWYGIFLLFSSVSKKHTNVHV